VRIEIPIRGLTVALLLLALAGCGGHDVRPSLRARLDQVFREVPPEVSAGRCDIALGVRAESVASLLTDRLRESLHKHESLKMDVGPVKGVASIELRPAWDDLGVELVPPLDGRSDRLDLAISLPTSVISGVGPLAVGKAVAASARVPIALTTSVGEGDRLSLFASIEDPDAVTLALEAQPVPAFLTTPFADAVLAAFRRYLHDNPVTDVLLVELPMPSSDEWHLPLNDARIEAFPQGAPTVQVLLETALPIPSKDDEPPQVLVPEDGDWVLWIDQPTLGAVLAGMQLAGRSVPRPTRLDVSDLRILEDRLELDVRLWRLHPPKSIDDFTLSGRLGLEGEELALDVNDVVVREELSFSIKKHIPPRIAYDVGQLAWPITAVQTQPGALLVEGRIAD